MHAAIACPACGLEAPVDSTECPRCHLSTQLFDAVREVAGDQPDPDPAYVQTIGEILTQLGDDPLLAPEGPGATQGRLAYPHRFPSPAADRGRPSFLEKPPPAPQPLGTLPALPPGGDVPLLLRQVNDLLQLGRRQGLNLSPYTERAREALATQDRPTLEGLVRDLFVFLAAALTEQYDAVIARRTELAGLVPTESPDVELEGCRASLALGDLAGAQRRLRHVEETLSDLEEQWATVHILVTEADLIATTIRELGGDPTPALGPLAEGQRRAREGDRAGAEPVLARATLALWSTLNPLLKRELARLRGAIVGRQYDAAATPVVTQALRQLATDLQHRNFAAAVLAYRSLRATLEPPRSPSLPAAAPAG